MTVSWSLSAIASSKAKLGEYVREKLVDDQLLDESYPLRNNLYWQLTLLIDAVPLPDGQLIRIESSGDIPADAECCLKVTISTATGSTKSDNFIG